VLGNECTNGNSVNVAHGIAMYGQPKYSADFTHFDYANPNAPKGGTITFGARGSFDTFNAHNAKGNIAVTRVTESLYFTESLLTNSYDEPFSRYGLIAESLEWPDDRSSVTFTLRNEARWHDGTPITPEDVVWSFETLISKGAPQYRFAYAGVEKVEKVDSNKVRFEFSDATNRELPLLVGDMPILPKHYWETRDFEKTTLEPPLGSGPYRISRFEAGRYIEQQRVNDYWGQHLPVNAGHYNFDILRTEFFRDDTAMRLALKSGDLDLRMENQAKAWALNYDTPAIEKQWLNKETIKHGVPTGMQAFVMNQRRAVFENPKVREALAYAFDFDWTNRNLFFSQYTRTRSYFSNSDLAATGLPKGRELEILENYRDRLPKRVFTEAYHPPKTDGSGWPRENLRAAFRLFDEAGWNVVDNKMTNRETGKALEFEILLVSPDFERIVLPMTRNLNRLGITVRTRVVDSSQYVNRLRSFDYDMFVFVWGQTESPGNEQQLFWSTEAADETSSRNFAGIKDPVVDELIEKVIKACDREQLVASTKALDRVLQWGFHVIPNWHLQADRVLHWNKFSRPTVPVKEGLLTQLWWYDSDKADALKIAMSENTGKTSSDSDSRQTPGWGTTIVAILLSLLALWWILRRLLVRRTNS